MGVDVEVLRGLNEQMAAECAQLTTEIWRDAGEEFNVNSTPQLRDDPVRQARAGRPRRRPRPGSRPTPPRSRSWPASTRSSSPCCATARSRSCAPPTASRLLAEVARRRPHPRHLQPDGGPHRPAQLRAAQPAQHPGPQPRRAAASGAAFVPAAGRRFLVADYNQIELRVIAHLAEDPGPDRRLPSAAPTSTPRPRPGSSASRPADVTIAMRSKAKMVSYGLAYGMEAYGLAQRLGIPTAEAQQILEAYFEAFPDGARATWTGWWPRPATGATPRRCSAGAARSPSCSSATTASARPASARP